MNTLTALTDAYVELVLDPWAQSNGPDKYVEEAYSEVVGALLRDGRTCAHAFGNAGWVPSLSDNPYRNLDRMKNAQRGGYLWGYPFLVSDTNHTGAFLGNDAANLAFRAHHDAMHLEFTAELDLVGEATIAFATCDRLCLSMNASAVIVAEVLGQSLFFERHEVFPLVDGRQPFAPVSGELLDWTRDCRSHFAFAT
jgi:hypothetical protein